MSSVVTWPGRISTVCVVLAPLTGFTRLILCMLGQLQLAVVEDDHWRPVDPDFALDLGRDHKCARKDRLAAECSTPRSDPHLSAHRPDLAHQRQLVATGVQDKQPGCDPVKLTVHEQPDPRRRGGHVELADQGTRSGGRAGFGDVGRQQQLYRAGGDRLELLRGPNGDAGQYHQRQEQQ